MTNSEAIDLAIDLIRAKAECDRLVVKLGEIYPQHSDRHAILRYRRFTKAIEKLEQLKRTRKEPVQ